MKLYNPKEFQDLVEYKDTIKDEKIKIKLERFLTNYNIMFLKFRQYLHDKESRKEMYDQVEKLGRENIALKEKLERKDRLIKLLKEEGY